MKLSKLQKQIILKKIQENIHKILYCKNILMNEINNLFSKCIHLLNLYYILYFFINLI